MTGICGNHVEGFGPSSNIHSNLPTACFTNTIVVPLATWIFIPLALIAFLFFNVSRRRNPPKENWTPQEPKRSRSIMLRIASILYYLLILAMLAMNSLEIARLSVSGLGVSLIPFTYVGLLLAAAIHFFWKSVVARVVNMVFWLMLAVVMAVQIAGLALELERLPSSSNPQYPLSDQLTDVGVMVGVIVVLFILEPIGIGRFDRANNVA